MRSAGLLIALAAAAAAEAPVARITVDPGRTHQTIDGFGVHLNATYFRESHKAMLDLLVKDLGATLFRLDPWGSSDWEWVNDDDDPSHPDQEYYRHRYSDGSFEAAWAAGRYLNSLGVKPILSSPGLLRSG